MPEVWIPSLMRKLTQGQDKVIVEGSTLREVIENLELQFPGIKDRVVYEDYRIAPGLAVAVDGVVTEEGLRTPVSPDCEIHFVTAIAGG
tara:strand:+ start:131 stop:397 length:267 start_codon:yes stop_codon:yes gene_type:complete